MPRRWLAAVAAAGALAAPAVLGAPAATAAGTPGTRSITAVTPGPFTSSLGQSSMTGSLTVQVSETAVTGDPTWYVTAQVADFTDGATPPHTLPASALVNSANSTVLVGGGGTISEGGAGSLSSPMTLFTDTGQSTSTVYNGTYTNTSTLTLTPPNGTYATQTGTTYTSTITITLFT